MSRAADGSAEGIAVCVPALLGMRCSHLRGVIATTRSDGHKIEIFRCRARGCCTLQDEGQSKGGELLPICQGMDGTICGSFEESLESGEPVGDSLRDIIKERGIDRPECHSCTSMRKQMNKWGIVGCNGNRAEILEHLRKQKTTWGEQWAMGTGGIWSVEGLLNAAMDRATLRS